MSAETDAPSGFHYEWVPDDPKWFRLVEAGEGEGHPCRGSSRWRKCPNPVVAVMFRKAFRLGKGYYTVRSFYCADHLYGRRIASGRLEHQRMVPNEDAL